MKAAETSLIVFFVGPPGVGKTTLVRAYMDHLDPAKHRDILSRPYPKWTICPDIFCAAGHYTGQTFDGADTVGYSQGQALLLHWSERFMSTMPVTIFDGDRFSNAKSWATIHAYIEQAKRPVAARVRIVHLDAPADVLAARCAERGSKQSAIWMKGRVTKAANFARLDPMAIRINADQSTPEMLKQCLAALAA